MQFDSLSFLLFFPIVVFVYIVIPSNTRKIWLLIASYYFYMNWNPKYGILILLSTIITYVSGILIDRDRQRKKVYVVISVIFNITILFYFKYCNFFIESLNAILGASGINLRTINVLLPVGISFYTFQALSYSFDVYAGKIEAEHSFITYALFVSFFPQLVAGPIERSNNLLKQIKKIDSIKVLDITRITSGLSLILYGIFLKLVLSDRIAILVDNVFNRYYLYGSVELIVAAVGFAFQIYFDFSSYSAVAIGAAEVLGIKLMDNFKAPYFAMSIKDFWSRWHISLSTWLRDYIYIPLGGNRVGIRRKYINLFATFVISGIWHGANWTYIFWGGVHGIFQVIEDGLTRRGYLKEARNFSRKLLKTISTFILVDFAWIFFRSDSIASALRYIHRMFTCWDIWTLVDGSIFTLGLNNVEFRIISVAFSFVAIVDYVSVKKEKRFNEVLAEQDWWFKWIVMTFIIVSIFVFGQYGPMFDSKQFIYFQF